MATKKKKLDSITLEMPGTIGSAKVILPETKIVKGSHLTITYNNGYPGGTGYNLNGSIAFEVA